MCDHAQDGHSGWSSVLNRKPVGKTPPLSYTHSHKLIHFAGGARVKNSECKSLQIRLVVCGSMRWVIITLMQQPAKKRLRRREEYTHTVMPCISPTSLRQSQRRRVHHLRRHRAAGNRHHAAPLEMCLKRDAEADIGNIFPIGIF